MVGLARRLPQIFGQAVALLVGNHSYAVVLVAARSQQVVALVFLLTEDRVDALEHDALEHDALVYELEDCGDDCRVAHRRSEVEGSAVPLPEDWLRN